MLGKKYKANHHQTIWSGNKFIIGCIVLASLLALGAYARYAFSEPTANPKNTSNLHFDASVTAAEKQTIIEAVQKQIIKDDAPVNIHTQTSLTVDQNPSVLTAYLPVSNVYATRQMITKQELSTIEIYIPENTDARESEAIALLLGLDNKRFKKFTTPNYLPDSAVALIPASDLSTQVKLLAFDGEYYLDNFNKGAIFREAEFSGDGASYYSTLKLNSYPTKDITLKVNMTGVTALTRLMMKKLDSVEDPNYFSQQIGTFLADADITHTSNEVSFKTGCKYSNTVFCAPPAMIEVLKSSGIDLIELTGNHNNDSGSQQNTESINLYHGLGWNTFGGGHNSTEAAKSYVADQKHSKVAFLGYNYADSPNGGPIATESTAGANSFDTNKIKIDIENTKQQSDFVIVTVQFSECYTYPAEHAEFPECDAPIAGQKETFRKIIDLGADMVIGTQAHQPQTYELYNGKPIYYGLGNLFFDQLQWPGTERGMILTHYFTNGKLLQTKVSPTVYGENYQTHLMDNDNAISLLQRLKTARQTAGL